MRRILCVTTVAAAVLIVALTPAYALRIAFKPPAQRALSADVVVVGTVTAVAREPVEVRSPYAGAQEKLRYLVATVKVGEGLIGGVKSGAEIKVGFDAPPKADPNAPPPPVRGIRPGRGFIALPGPKPGQELILFLTKHPAADFYIFTGMNLPVELKDEQGKNDLATVKRLAALLADPLKGLKSDKPEVRAETAVALVMKYRAYPGLGGEVEAVPLPEEESRLILQGLAEGDWSNDYRPGLGLSPIQAFYQLGLSEREGWVQPVVVNPPGAPPVDFNAVMKDAFQKWLAGPGKNYVLKKNVAKTHPAGK